MNTHAATPGPRGLPSDADESGPEPTDAELARTLLHHTSHGTLATVAVNPAGFPFGSLVGHALDGQGRPLLCLSDMAEHTTNLAADPSASLLVIAAVPAGTDPLAGARATLIGELREVPTDERADALEQYLAVHPEAFYATFDDFRLYRIDVAALRFVGGYGRMSWVDAREYRAAEPDPLHLAAAGIIEHLNDDHADALVEFCRVLGGRPDTESAHMVGVDRYGFEVATGDRVVRIAFEQTCDSPDAVRAAMVALLAKVRSAG